MSANEKIRNKFNREFWRLLFVCFWSALLMLYWNFSAPSKRLLSCYSERVEKEPSGLFITKPALETLQQNIPKTVNISHLPLKIEPIHQYEVEKVVSRYDSSSNAYSILETSRIITTKIPIDPNHNDYITLPHESEPKYRIYGKINRQVDISTYYPSIFYLINTLIVFVFISSFAVILLAQSTVKIVGEEVDLSIATALSILVIGVVQSLIAFVQGGPLISPYGTILGTTAAITIGQMFYVLPSLLNGEPKKGRYIFYILMTMPFIFGPFISYVYADKCFDFGDKLIIKETFAEPTWYIVLTVISVILGGLVTYKRRDEDLNVDINLGILGATKKLVCSLMNSK